MSGNTPARSSSSGSALPSSPGTTSAPSSTRSPPPPLDGARSISSVLHGRLQQLQLPDLGHEVTWAQRTPANAPAVAHELAAGWDQRARALGEQLAASPEPWLAIQLGILAPHASPALRGDYARRAATAAVYREAAGITDPRQAIVPEPHRGNPALDHLRRSAIRALEIRDETEIVRGMTHGELEARVLDADRALASALPDVSRELRLTAQAEADAWQQSADAEIKHDPTESAGAKALARQPGGPARAARSCERPLREMGCRHRQQEGSSRESQGRAAAPPVRAAARARRPAGPPGRAAGPRGRGRAPHRRRQCCAEARAQYIARLEREAHAQTDPAAERQAEALDGIEIEL